MIKLTSVREDGGAIYVRPDDIGTLCEHIDETGKVVGTELSVAFGRGGTGYLNVAETGEQILALINGHGAIDPEMISADEDQAVDIVNRVLTYLHTWAGFTTWWTFINESGRRDVHNKLVDRVKASLLR